MLKKGEGHLLKELSVRQMQYYNKIWENIGNKYTIYPIYKFKIPHFGELYWLHRPFLKDRDSRNSAIGELKSNSPNTFIKSGCLIRNVLEGSGKRYILQVAWERGPI